MGSFKKIFWSVTFRPEGSWKCYFVWFDDRDTAFDFYFRHAGAERPFPHTYCKRESIEAAYKRIKESNINVLRGLLDEH